MKTKIEAEFRSFMVPNFVQEEVPTEDGGVTTVSRHLSALDSYALDALCTEFREAVFAKAKKQQPAQQARLCPKCERAV